MLSWTPCSVQVCVPMSQVAIFPHQIAVTPIPTPASRVRVKGKFLFADKEKFYVKGVTYGAFRSDESGREFPPPQTVDHDFAQMAAYGINTVRTYTVPPRDLLDAALRHGLRVMVGIPWEQHITFLDDASRTRSIINRVRAAVRSCGRHQAILCYAIGNEIPAPIVRWYGHRRIERFLRRLFRAAKMEDPEGLFTYVNYPTTEYLQLPFLDLVCFNVYLETEEALGAYLARLQNLTGDRPLLMAEVGLDSRGNGEHKQAEVLAWQIRRTFVAGCAGTFVFAWTDEWHRGGHDILDWDFGLTRRDRRPKPALLSVRRAFQEAPFPSVAAWPRISVVICTYNGNRTISETVRAVAMLDYPNYEVIVVDDGSTHDVAAAVGEHEIRLIRTPNQGLSNARNVGLEASDGEIVAYLDDDAYPDPHWLHYLGLTFLHGEHVAVGGPNIPPLGDSFIANAVAHSPGGPAHVLLSDEKAEHIPGCNMAFRKEALQAIGGFDAQFRVAGDDVDVCWRLQDRGWTIGFSPAAVVWHHRRNSVRTYLKQQAGYGKAEALLEKKWPQRYNGAGHLSWAGRVYGTGVSRIVGLRPRVYHGTWGLALFQSLYEPAPNALAALLLMPEWYLVMSILTALTGLGVAWRPLVLLLPLLVLAVGASATHAVANASRARFIEPGGRLRRFGLHALTCLLHLLQPAARLWGRLRYGLGPLRLRGVNDSFPWPHTAHVWSETWRAPEDWLRDLEMAIRNQGLLWVRGNDYERWDIEVRSCGLLGSARLLVAVEEHGAGRQLVRFRFWPRGSLLALSIGAAFAFAAIAAVLDGAGLVGGALGLLALLAVYRVWRECAVAVSGLHRSLDSIRAESGKQ